MPSLLIDIEGRLNKFADALEQANKQVLGFKHRTERALDGVGKITFGILGAEAIEHGLERIKDLMHEVFEAAKEDERGLNQLKAVISTTGNAAGFTSKQIQEMADELKDKTVYDDEEIRKAATALLRFRNIQGEVFKEALALAPALATALGTDLQGATQAIGKALSGAEGGFRALKAAGFDLTQQEIDLEGRLRETGKTAEANRIILDALARSVGGAAEAENQGLYGASKRLERSWKDLEKAIGHRIFDDNTTNVDLLTKALDRLTEASKGSHHWLTQLAAAGAGSLLGPVGTLFAAGTVGMPFSGKNEKDQMAEERRALREMENESLEETRAADRAIAVELKQAAEAQKMLRRKTTEQAASEASKIGAVNLQQVKAGLDLVQMANEDAYKRGLKSIQDYYAEQKRIVESGVAVQLDVLGQQGVAAEKAFAASARQADDKLKLTSRLQAVATASDQARIDAKKQLTKLGYDSANAQEADADALTELNAKLEEQNGHLTKALELRNEIANRPLKEKPELLEAKKQLDTRGTTDARIQELRNEDDIIRQHLANQEQLLQAQRDAGSITEIDRLNQVDRARLAVVDTLKKHAAQLRAVADASDDLTGKLHLEAEAAEVAVAALEASIGGLEKAFRDIGEGTMQTFFEDFASGTKSMKDLFNDAVRSITAGISRIAAQELSEKLFKKDSTGGGLLSWFAKLWDSGGGGGGGGENMAGGMQARGAAYSMGGHEITRFGLGGVVTSPRFFRAAMGVGLMGEAGPEAIMPLHRGADGKLGVRGGGGVNVTMNISTPDVQSFAQSQGQIAKKAALVIAGARRNL